jgi:hypothetical protein
MKGLDMGVLLVARLLLLRHLRLPYPKWKRPWIAWWLRPQLASKQFLVNWFLCFVLFDLGWQIHVWSLVLNTFLEQVGNYIFGENCAPHVWCVNPCKEKIALQLRTVIYLYMHSLSKSTYSLRSDIYGGTSIHTCIQTCVYTWIYIYIAF